MAIQHRHNTQTNTVMVACPFCGEELPDGIGFSKHWPECGANSNA